MNFLSHYYLHRKTDDNFFTVGLTVPDLLGFHSKRVRVTENSLIQMRIEVNDENLKSCVEGMLIHLKVDKWFHGSAFFNEKVMFLKNNYIQVTGFDDIPHHICHILIEILLDRLLLVENPYLAEEFYSSYKKFDFEKLSEILILLNNFDRKKFISLTNNVSNSSFLHDYLDFNEIINILERVSNRIGFPIKLLPDREKVVDFISMSYESLEMSMSSLFMSAKEVEF